MKLCDKLSRNMFTNSVNTTGEIVYWQAELIMKDFQTAKNRTLECAVNNLF